MVSILLSHIFHALEDGGVKLMLALAVADFSITPIEPPHST